MTSKFVEPEKCIDAIFATDDSQIKTELPRKARSVPAMLILAKELL